MRGMRGNKRETRRRKTYAGRENWQDSRSFERDEKEENKRTGGKGPTQVKETSCLVGFRRKLAFRRKQASGNN